MAKGPRKRAATKVEEENPEEVEASPGEGGEEPIHASLDADQAKEGGDDYWDLDDDGDWGGSRQSSASMHRQILRRSNVEIGVSFVCHLVLMCFYIFVHVYDATIFKRSKGVGFEGHFTYGGRWKYLTYLNLVRCCAAVVLKQEIYFCFHFSAVGPVSVFLFVLLRGHNAIWCHQSLIQKNL